MKKWVFFDLDGTLTDPMIGITSSVKYALEKFGIEVQYLKDLIPFIGPPLKDSFMEFYGLSEEEAEQAVSYYREYFGPRGLYENEVYPGIKEMLLHLERVGFDLAVATSKPTEYADRILRHFGLREHFTVVIGSELDGRRSNKADVIAYALRRTQVSADEVIMVGDRKHDMIGAEKCKVDCIGVTYGYGSRQELEAAGATYLVDTVGQLEEKILSILESEIEEEKIQTRRVMSWNRSERRGQESQAEIPGRRISLGILGCNDIAEKFYQANRFGKQTEFTAFCGDTMEEALEFASRKGRVMCFDSPSDLGNWDGVEAVFVCSDLKNRYNDCRTMLEAGKHVLCQAPVGFKVEEVKDLYQLAQEKNVMLMESNPALYAPAFEKMLPYLASLGEVRQATMLNCHYSKNYSQWKYGILTKDFDPSQGGSALMEMGIYPISAMIRLFGPPKSIHASGVRLKNGMDITGTILMEYDGMTGQAIYSKITDSAMPSQIQGEEGSMLIREIENIKDLRISRSKVDQSVHFEQSDNILNHVTNSFIRTIMTGMGMDKNEELSVNIMKVLEEAIAQMELSFR